MYFERSIVISVLVVLAVYFQTAHCLDCIKCQYNSTMASAQQVCNNSNVETCSAHLTYCDAQVHTDAQNITSYNRGCALGNTCLYPTTYCDTLKTSPSYKECKRSCCQTNSCNDEFPSVSDKDADNGVDHTKVGQTAFAMALVAAILLA